MRSSAKPKPAHNRTTGPSPAALPLSTLLSQTLVAFTIESDNEFEHRTPHRTSNFGGSQGPWLASMAMWWTCMRFVGDDGVRVADLERLARTGTNLNGMQRWGYIVLKPDPADPRPKPPPSAWRIHATAKGRFASEVWRPLSGIVEQRWQDRFGKAAINQLRDSLDNLLGRIPLQLPDCLPILGYGLYTKGRVEVTPNPPDRKNASENPASPPDLPTLLSRVLVAFALDFERESELSLAISANLLRILNETGVPLRDLPLLSGVSKESISMAMGILNKARMIVNETDPAGIRAKVVRLTPKGLEAQDQHQRLLATIEDRWREQFGSKPISQLRKALERLVGDPGSPRSPLFAGLKPYPDGWRAKVRQPDVLPHYPMVLHRGGYPDGS